MGFRPERQIVLTSKLKTICVRPVWRRTPLFYITILATLCIKGLSAVSNLTQRTQRTQAPCVKLYASIMVAMLALRHCVCCVRLETALYFKLFVRVGRLEL